MGAEIIYKGIRKWMYKWGRHGCVGASGPVGLWRQIYALVILHGDTLIFQWAPSHVHIEGNEQADKLAEQGGLQHPYNESQEPERHYGLQGRALWLHLGSEKTQSGSDPPRSCDSEPPSDLGSDPGTHGA